MKKKSDNKIGVGTGIIGLFLLWLLIYLINPDLIDNILRLLWVFK